MINLLSNEAKKQIKASYANTILVKCLAWLGVAVLFLALSCLFSYLFLSNDKNQKDQSSATVQPTQILYNTTKTKFDGIKSDIDKAKSLLSAQSSYSDVIIGIANALPSGTILDSLSMDQTSYSSPISLKVKARSNDRVSAIKTGFDNSSLFSGYSQTVTTDQSDQSGYPVIVTVSVSINKGASL